MYDEQLEKLIEMAIVDGELSAKEKLTLFKKAESLGIDLDEFELILDGRLFERQQALKNSQPAPAEPAASAAPTTPKSEKFGDIRKCPACGAIVGAMQALCGDCGHSFTSIESVSSVTKLYEQLQLVETEERNRKVEGGLIGRISGSAAAQDPQLEERIKKRKAGVVSAFPVPNSKEDIVEFLSMAVPEAGKKPNFLMMMSGAGDLYKAWRGKAEQVVIKARFSLKDDKKLLEEINNYAQQLNIK